MNPFDKLVNGIPLHEAAAFFLKMKTAEPVAPPDESGALEGQFAAPVEQVLAAMGQQLEAELKTNYAYRVYAGSLRDLSHMAIAEHFQEHADDETDHAEWLVRRMTVLGGPVAAPDIAAPPATTDPYEIIHTMIRMEQDGIALWRQLRDLVGEDNPTRYKIEEYLTVEQEHLDELWQLLPHTERSAVIQEGPAPSTGAAPQTPPAPDASPDTGGSDKAASVKTAASVEKFHPGTLQYHGAAMKLALAAKSPTVFVPNIDLEGNLKEAAAKMANAVPPAPPPAPALQGAAAGQHQAAPAMAPLSGPAAGQVAKMAAKMKRAFDDVAPNALPAPGGQEHAELQQYMQEEMAGQQAEHEGEQVFYKQKFEEAVQRMQAAEQQSQAAQQQVEQLQQQVDAGAQQNQQALAQAQQIQESAMQQATQANVAATQAMQKSLASSNELLQQQQLAVNMRDAMQQLKTQLMGIVQTQLPPSTTTEAGVSAQAQQMADQQSQVDAQQMATEASASGQENQQQGAQQPGGQDAAENQAGAPAASPDAGTPPTSATPGDSQQGAGSSPNSAETSRQPAEGASTQSSKTTEDGGRSVSVKVGHEEKTAADHFIDAITGGGPEAGGRAARLAQMLSSDHALGAMGGALIGGAGTAIESQMSNDPLRAKVKKLEAAERSGEGGFGNAMNLAQSKMRLAMGEMLEKHPVAGTLAGAGLGALSGAKAGPAVRDIAQYIRR